MTILTLNRAELEKKIGAITPELEDEITMMGTPIEEVTDEILSVEIFPNRPDLLSLQNFARAVNQFREKSKIAQFKINKPEKDYTVTIEKEVKNIRPYTVCAIAKGLKLTDERLENVIDLQEKLHGSLGRKRKKVAIGIYPLDKIALPIRYTAKSPEEIKFIPLEEKKQMGAKQILKNHPTGNEYRDLLKGFEKYPLFIDANDEILSMPPIINSEKTGRVTNKTKEIFIECSGSNLHYVQKCLAIIIATLEGMNAKVYAMNILDKSEKNVQTPQMQPEVLSFKIEDIEKTLGIKLSEKQVKSYLGRMGIGFEKNKSGSIALIPAYRADILHWIDLAEDCAIAYGYENFEPELPNISTIAHEQPFEKNKQKIAEILTGLGLLETSSFHLTTKKDIKKMHYDFTDFLEVLDSKTKHEVLRIDLLTNALQILSENSDAAYPQKIFEMGTVFRKDEYNDGDVPIKETENLSIALVDEKVTFTDLKQILDYLFKMLNVTYDLEVMDNHNYIPGRVAAIIVNNKRIGFIGEIAPRVIKNYKIKMPVAAMEIDVGFLKD